MKCRFCNNTAQNCNIEYTKQSKTNKNKINYLPNPPQGGDEGGENFEKRKAVMQEDIVNLQLSNIMGYNTF